MHLALYRTERPETFDEIIGQDHIVRILRNQIATGHVSQAYLFAGTRGTGKTTTARILAKAVNCTGENPPCGKCDNCRSIADGTFMDVRELDAASNNGVDDLRAVIDSVQYPPAVGKYKVYIIDEVHMLSQAAENAFLKTLEEPPEYAIFILATTDPEKVKATIRSRCMILNFRRVSETDLIAGMQRICLKRGVNASEEGLGIIARKADGSVRDALSILEQCIETGEKDLTPDLVLDYTGSAGEDFYIQLTDAVKNRDIGTAMNLIDEIIRAGRDARQLLIDWLEHWRDLMIVKYVDDPSRIIHASEENIARLKDQANELDISEIKSAVRYLSSQVNQTRYTMQPRILLEVSAVELIEGVNSAPAPDNRPVRNRGAVIQPGQRIGSSHKTSRGRSTPSRSSRASGGSDTGAAAQARTNREEAHHDPAEASAAPESGRITGSEDDEQSQPVQSDAVIESGGFAPAVSSPEDLDDMWDQILGEVAKNNLSFEIMVGRNSAITDYYNDEITLTVKGNKLSIAEDAHAELDAAAKKLYGERAFFTLKAGDVEEAVKKRNAKMAASGASDKATGSGRAPSAVNSGMRKKDQAQEPAQGRERTVAPAGEGSEASPRQNKEGAPSEGQDGRDAVLDKTVRGVSSLFGLDASDIKIIDD